MNKKSVTLTLKEISLSKIADQIMVHAEFFGCLDDLIHTKDSDDTIAIKITDDLIEALTKKIKIKRDYNGISRHH